MRRHTDTLPPPSPQGALTIFGLIYPLASPGQQMHYNLCQQ